MYRFTQETDKENVEINTKTGNNRGVCNYNNDANNVATYGRLYNFYAVVDSRNLCPTGWHAPSDNEWTTLLNYLGGDSAAGVLLKGFGNGTNTSGFTALAGGLRYSLDAYYGNMGSTCYFWSSTINNNNSAWEIILDNFSIGVVHTYGNKYNGESVRCLKD